MGRVGNMQEMEAITVANRDGRTITIGDLGRAEDSTEEIQSASLYNDTPCVLLNIRKQSGTNTVEVAEALKERLENLKATMPKGYRIEVVRDQSVFIEASVDTVKEHLMLGGVLAAVVVFFFLANIRATMIAALSIPTSIIAAFAIVKYMGFTLNSITLLALTLSVGIVIDDAIVVMENIFRYIEEKKYTPFEAAMAATGEIGLAVMAITLSLVAVFLPIAMMEGIVGRFLKSFGITMAGHDPGEHVGQLHAHADAGRPLVQRTGRRRRTEHADDGRSKAGGSKGQVFYHVIEGVYLVCCGSRCGIAGSSCWPWSAAWPRLPVLFRIVPKNFMPDDDSSEFQVSVQAPKARRWRPRRC